VTFPKPKVVLVDDLETNYYEAGRGPTVVLLHSGEHGGSTETTWAENFAALADQFHVVAPDWLGYGRSAKVHDFTSGTGRKLSHMKRFLESIGIDRADFVGSSMGGALAVRSLAADPDYFPARSLTLLGAGGYAPDNEHRRALLDYDGSFEGMRRIVAAMYHDPRFAADDEFIRVRYESSIAPGAWECTAASRFKSPLVAARSDFGQQDITEYERVEQPVLVIGGACDKLKEAGYGDILKNRFRDAEVHILPDCGHMPNVERPDLVNDLLIAFLRRVNGLS